MLKGKVNWAIVGLGDIVRKRVGSAILQQPNSSVYACVSRNPDKRREDLERLQPAKVFTDFKEMLADEDVDAVYLATPVNLHAPQTIAALKAGKDVLVEKPMAMNSAQATEICRAAQQSGRRLSVAYYRRFWERFQLVKDMLDGGDFGQVVSVRIALREWYQPDLADPKAWRVKPEMSGGGVLMDVGCHRLDLLAWWFGLPKRLVASIRKGRYQTEDSATVLMTLDNGADVTVSFNWDSKALADEIHLVGTEAKVTLLPCDGPEVSIYAANELQHRQIPKPTNAHYPLIDDFARAIVAGRSPRFSAADGMKATQIMDVIFYSSASDTWQEVC